MTAHEINSKEDSQIVDAGREEKENHAVVLAYLQNE